MENPFRIAGTTAGVHFTDREAEVRKMVAILREPQAKLVVYGPRRMGKSSAMAVAARRVETRYKVPVIFADVSTVSGEADIATRVMQGAIQAFGKKWQDTFKQFATRLSAKLTISVDPVTGLPTVGVEPTVRDASEAAQRDNLGEVLDTIDALAAQRGGPVGIMLDEFQDIHRYGGEQAEWHLRGIIQRHQHVSYILAGSSEALITAMISERTRAFYELAERLYIGPIDPVHMAAWIDERFESAEVRANHIGATIVTIAGPRTRDRVRLARATFATVSEKHRVDVSDVETALDQIVEEMAPEYSLVWRALPPNQQNVLRAVAAGAGTLFQSDIRERFSLGKTSGTTAKAIARLVDLEYVTRSGTGTGYVFDSPFFARWVSTRTLQDVGSGPLPLLR
ncbi:MAG TPA: ATP-binding protein [Gemmatimonadaceae bacterium]|nr:ATP-binding protein [Gemmatimonadaceae bacterium]